MPKRPARPKPKPQTKLRCPECNSTKLVKNGFQVVARKKVQRFLCNSCFRNSIHPRGEI